MLVADTILAGAFLGPINVGFMTALYNRRNKFGKCGGKRFSRNCCGFWVNLALPVDFIQRLPFCLKGSL
jgi:hypothetical protein